MAIVQPFPPETPILGAKLSSTERSLIRRFMDEKGFFNPLADLINQVKARAGGLSAILTAAAAVPEPNLVYAPLTSAELTAIAAALSALAGECDDYLEHTNRLTGVTFDDTANPPDLSGLLGTATGYNSAKESMREPTDPKEDNFSPIFYSLVSGEAEQILTRALGFLNTAQSSLVAGNRVGNAAVLRGVAAGTSSRLSGLAAQDNANYTAARAYLRKYGTAISLNAAFSSDDWSYFYARNNVGDGFTKSWVETIRSEKALSENLQESTYTDSASTLRS